MAAGDVVQIGPVDIPTTDSDFVVTGTPNSAVINALQGRVTVNDLLVGVPVGGNKLLFIIVKGA